MSYSFSLENKISITFVICGVDHIFLIPLHINYSSNKIRFNQLKHQLLHILKPLLRSRSQLPLVDLIILLPISVHNCFASSIVQLSIYYYRSPNPILINKNTSFLLRIHSFSVAALYNFLVEPKNFLLR